MKRRGFLGGIATLPLLALVGCGRGGGGITSPSPSEPEGEEGTITLTYLPGTRSAWLADNHFYLSAYGLFKEETSLALWWPLKVVVHPIEWGADGKGCIVGNSPGTTGCQGGWYDHAKREIHVPEDPDVKYIYLAQHEMLHLLLDVRKGDGDGGHSSPLWVELGLLGR